MQQELQEPQGLELLETTLPLPDEEPQERPRRRPYQRRQKSDTPEDATRSSGTPDDQPRRKYQRRAAAPEKLVERDAEALEAQLAAMFLLLGGAAGMVLPVTGRTMQMRATQGAAAVIEAAKANPRIAAAVIALTKVGHYGPLVMFGATMVTAVGVDMGLVPPLSPPAQMMISDVVSTFGAPTPSQNGYAAAASEASHE